MTISAAQIREARALLKWGTPMLAKRASVGFDVALRAQKDLGLPMTMGLELRAIRDAFKRAGVIFSAQGDNPGTRLRKAGQIGEEA